MHVHACHRSGLGAEIYTHNGADGRTAAKDGAVVRAIQNSEQRTGSRHLSPILTRNSVPAILERSSAQHKNTAYAYHTMMRRMHFWIRSATSVGMREARGTYSGGRSHGVLSGKARAPAKHLRLVTSCLSKRSHRQPCHDAVQELV